MSDSIVGQEFSEPVLPVINTVHSTNSRSPPVLSQRNCEEDLHCSSCEAFIRDWLELPLTPDEEFYYSIKWPSVWRITHELSKIFFQLLLGMSKSHKYAIEFFHNNSINNTITPTLKFSRLQIVKFIDKKEIDYLISVLEDNGCSYDNEILKEWIGYCLLKLWNNLEDIHLEHQMIKPPSSLTVPLGLRSFKPSASNELC